MPQSRLVRAAALAMLVVVGCASFGEGRDDGDPAPPTPAADGGSDDAADADLGPIPAEEPVKGNTGIGSTSSACVAKMTGQGALFCSDFDDVADPWVGWDRNEPLSDYAVDSAEKISAPNAARLAIKATLGSPDLPLKHELPPRTHFTIKASVRLSSPRTPPTDAVLMKLQFKTGALFFRSSGRAIETIPSDAGPAKFVERLSSAEIPLDKWLDVELVVDLPTGKFDLSVDGTKRSGTMETKRASAESVLLIVGPMDPRPTEPSDLTMRLDDVFVSAP